MTPKKLTAGDGYEYLTRQVAVHDSTERGRSSLNDYYSAKGESPGTWLGAGLSAFTDISAGDLVSESQMKALYGEGRHPDAEAIEARRVAELVAEGMKPKAAAKAAVAETKLGAAYRVYKGASEFRQAVAAEFTTYNTTRGLKWNTLIAGEDRAAIRTKVARDMFTKELGRGPLDEAELSGWVARNNRQKTTAVAGYDLCFSPVKSVSALHAVAPLQVKQRIEKANWLALQDTLAHIEANYAYTRVGTNGVAQVDIEGLIAAAFVHRDSRCGDPDWHVHVVISNKVQTRGTDGELRWLALDGNPIYKNAVAFSEYFNTRNEAHLREELGVAFAERGDTDPGKRPIREIVGVDPDLCRFWSSRRKRSRFDAASSPCNSRPSTVANRPRSKRPHWLSRPTSTPVKPNTNRAAKPNNAPSGVRKQSRSSVANAPCRTWCTRRCTPPPAVKSSPTSTGSRPPPTGSSRPSPPPGRGGSPTTFAPRCSASCARRTCAWRRSTPSPTGSTSAAVAPVRSLPIHHVENLTEPAELRHDDGTGVSPTPVADVHQRRGPRRRAASVSAAHAATAGKSTPRPSMSRCSTPGEQPRQTAQRRPRTTRPRVRDVRVEGAGRARAGRHRQNHRDAGAGAGVGSRRRPRARVRAAGSAAGVLRADIDADTDHHRQTRHRPRRLAASVKAVRPVLVPEWFAGSARTRC